MKNHGFSYIEIILSMTLISIFSICLVNRFDLKNYKFARENYFADIAVENLLNIAEAEFATKNSVSDIEFDKFNFTVRVNEIEKNFSVSQNIFTSCGNENFLPINTEIYADTENLFDISKSYLLTVDLFDKNHKFLKRLTKIITNS